MNMRKITSLHEEKKEKLVKVMSFFTSQEIFPFLEAKLQLLIMGDPRHHSTYCLNQVGDIIKIFPFMFLFSNFMQV